MQRGKSQPNRETRQKFLSKTLMRRFGALSLYPLSVFYSVSLNSLSRSRCYPHVHRAISVGGNIPVSVFPVLGLTLGMVALDAAVMTRVANAYTREISVTVQWDGNENYEGLTRRAELAARTAAQQIFDRDILVTEVDITVLGQSGASIVPVLVMVVSRNDWRDRPDPQYWSRYFNSSRALLELNTLTTGEN